jgi:elongation factor 1-beta
LLDFILTLELSSSSVLSFKASQADVAVFEEVKTAPDAGSYPHAARWFAHIAAHKAGFAKLPGTKKAASEYAPGVTVGESKAAASSSAAPKADEEDDIDLFGSDDDLDEEAERIKAERVAAYQAKKSDKPAVIAKSQVVLDVKPWDDETDMDALTKHVKSIEMEGLLWGAHKLGAVGYGIKKLQITVGCNLVLGQRVHKSF